MSSSGLLLFRADGGPNIGAGHVMRSLALAHAWQDAGGQAVLAARERPAFFDARSDNERIPSVAIEAEPGSLSDADMTARVARELGAAWIAIDGYRFDTRYQRRLRDSGLSVLMIDDEGGHDHCSANVLLNPNLNADPSRYASVDPDTRILLGPRYALLRREFWSWSTHSRRFPKTARNLLVLLGGSDSHRLASRLVDAIGPLAAEGIRFDLVSASTDRQLRSLRRRSAGMTGAVGVASMVADMPRLMAETDLALSAAGSTCWELAFLAVPTLVVALATNQRAVAEGLDRAGAAVDLGWHEDLHEERIREEIRRLARSSPARRRLGAAARMLVDAEGGRRVVMLMRGDPIRLRPADPRDMVLLWTWANSADVRASSLSPGPIAIDVHQRWYKAQLADPATMIFVAVDADDQPIGQVRFNPSRGTEAVISVSLAREWRGHGLGWRLIEMGSRRALNSNKVTRIHAFIRPENRASIRAFGRSGYRPVGVEDVDGTLVEHWVLTGTEA